MNYSDSNRIKAILQRCWFEYTSNIDNSDIIIINTCSVRQKAEDKITWMLKNIKKTQKIWITWCMIQHNLKFWKINEKIENKKINKKFNKWNFLWNIIKKDPKIIWLNQNDLISKKNIIWNKNDFLFVNYSFNPMFTNFKKKYENLELFFRIDDLWFFPLLLKTLWYKINEDIEIQNEYSKIIPSKKSESNLFWWNNNPLTNPKTSYIPISTWCNQFCSYCIVPYARWFEKYYNIEQIINELDNNIKNWAKEIYLLWQIVNKHPNFYKILNKVLEKKWYKRLRYTSPYPTYYNDNIFKLHEEHTKLCPHIHIPVQSWSDEILKKMFRWYTIKEYKNFINKIYSLNRKISITTDIIVWFPWETEKNFQETLELVKYCKFDMIYIWIYSNRPWTYARKNYNDDIPYKIKYERRNKLNNLLSEISKQNNKLEIWNIKEVLIDDIKNKLLIWHTDNMKTVEIITKSDKYKIWDFVNAKIIKSQSLKLFWNIFI